MSKVLNKDKLNEIFDVESNDDSFFSSEMVIDEINNEVVYEVAIDDNDEYDSYEIDTFDDDIPPTTITETDEYLSDSVKSLMTDVQEIIGVAKYLCDSSPDSESITAASNMCNSATQLVKELNKGVLQRKKLEFQERLEDKKIKARMKLEEFKAKNNKKVNLNNSTINVQNNTIEAGHAPFSQEDIVKELLKQNNKNSS